MADYYIFLIVGVAYLFGSFPSAYILVRKFYNKDIRQEGSGNVGAMNTLHTTGNRLLAVLAALLDMAKGAVPAFLFSHIFPLGYIHLITLLLGVLLGHLYSVWIGFRGGRGLAVTAGVFLVISPPVVGVWVVLWLIYFTFLRNSLISTLIATFIMPLIVFFTVGSLFSSDILLMVLPVSMLIFQRHLSLIKTLPGGSQININGVQ